MPTNGTVYLLLSKNGKYKELRESDLLKEAAIIIKDPSLRLVKGQYFDEMTLLANYVLAVRALSLVQYFLLLLPYFKFQLN